MSNQSFPALAEYPARRTPARARYASLWLLAALVSPVAVSAQQDSLKACNLLTPTELSAVIGGSVAHASGRGRPYKKLSPVTDHDGIVYTCSEDVGMHRVEIHYNTSPVTAAGKKFAQDHAREAEEELRNQGYQVQTRDLSGAHCTSILPGSGAKNAVEGAVGTACVLEKGLYVLSVYVSATGASDVCSMEKVASLVEKAASRVPTQ